MNTREQVVKIIIPATTNPEVSIKAEVDRLFDRICRIVIYTNSNRYKNENLVVTNPVQIGGREVFPLDWDTELNFQSVDNEACIRKNIEHAGGKTVEGRVRYLGTPSAPIVAKMILFLEKTDRQ